MLHVFPAAFDVAALKAISGLQARKLAKAWQAVLRNCLCELREDSADGSGGAASINTGSQSHGKEVEPATPTIPPLPGGSQHHQAASSPEPGSATGLLAMPQAHPPRAHGHGHGVSVSPRDGPSHSPSPYVKRSPSGSLSLDDSAIGLSAAKSAASSPSAAAPPSVARGRQLRQRDSNDDDSGAPTSEGEADNRKQYYLHSVLREFALLKASGSEAEDGLLTDE